MKQGVLLGELDSGLKFPGIKDRAATDYFRNPSGDGFISWWAGNGNFQAFPGGGAWAS